MTIFRTINYSNYTRKKKFCCCFYDYLLQNLYLHQPVISQRSTICEFHTFIWNWFMEFLLLRFIADSLSRATYDTRQANYFRYRSSHYIVKNFMRCQNKIEEKKIFLMICCQIFFSYYWMWMTKAWHSLLTFDIWSLADGRAMRRS